jgi:hypothetical protein
LGVIDKDRLHAELADDLRRGVLLPAKAAALFDIDEAKLRQISIDAYPLSLPEVAVSIATKQLVAAVEAAKQGGGVAQALEHLGASAHEVHLVKLVIDARLSSRR